MAFSRPSLSDLRTQVAQALAAALPGTDSLLPNSNLDILGSVLAGLSHLHYGYLDWIAQQCTPYTATDEFLELWAALKGVTRLPATQASGTVTFTGVNGTFLASGKAIARGDGRTYTTTSSGTVSGGSVTVAVLADAAPAGLDGAGGNCPSGTTMSLASPVAGINSTGTAATTFTGGADLEGDDSLRLRMLLAYQKPARGGSADDYVRWALEVPGVTRAWCVPHADGAGSVALYTMFDAAESAFGGFPQGTNGAATGEVRASTATGDQLAVANHIFPLQPVTALVRAYAPAQNTVNFTISGISGASPATKAAIAAAITAVFQQYGTVGSTSTTVPLSYVQSAVAAVPNTAGFLITAPAGNITSAAGALPVLGSVTYV